MLATVLLVLPPIVARLPIPRFFHSGEIVAIALAAIAAWRTPTARQPFLIVIGVMVVQIALFETVGASDGWAQVFKAFGRQPVWPYAGVVFVVSLIALLCAWKRTPLRPRNRALPPAMMS